MIPLEVERAEPAPRASVWVVDDDLRTAQVLAGLLQMDGLSVEVCGGEALPWRLAHAPAPAVLVLNMSMARADEVRAVRQVRGGHPELPIVIITEYPHLAPRLGPQLEPLPAIFTKPVDYPALLTALRAALTGAGDHPPQMRTALA